MDKGSDVDPKPAPATDPQDGEVVASIEPACVQEEDPVRQERPLGGYLRKSWALGALETKGQCLAPAPLSMLLTNPVRGSATQKQKKRAL